VDRTTDGTGRVNDFTLAELQALDAGYDWPTVAEESHRTDRPYRGQGVMIATLEEVLTTFPQMRMMIEIKQAEPSIAQPLCDLLRQTNMQQQVVVASFRAPALYAFRAVCPEVATSAVEDEVRTYLVLNNLGLSAAYQPSAYAFQVPEYSGDIHVVTRSFVENALPHNIVVQPWTINSEADMQRMIDLGVNGIITDYPSRLMTLLGR
jgi:glycerophosphoryl diester phosphodiesterase